MGRGNIQDCLQLSPALGQLWHLPEKDYLLGKDVSLPFQRKSKTAFIISYLVFFLLFCVIYVAGQISGKWNQASNFEVCLSLTNESADSLCFSLCLSPRKQWDVSLLLWHGWNILPVSEDKRKQPKLRTADTHKASYELRNRLHFYGWCELTLQVFYGNLKFIICLFT